MRKPEKPQDEPWSCTIAEEQWRVYKDAIAAARGSGSPFLVGGAFGLAAYTRRCRNTKDLDLFVLPEDKDRVVDALTKMGFDDYYPALAYDRGWIYRSVRDDTIVDVIWRTPNRRSEVDALWFQHAPQIRIRDEVLAVIPAEELLAIKIYVLQRDRCDWPDLLNLLYAAGETLDWDHLLERMSGETPLVAGLLQVFNWVAPDRARLLPEAVRERFHLPRITADELSLDPRCRVDLLDSRPWFAAFQPMDKAMQL